jgi:hypothetical protein
MADVAKCRQIARATLDLPLRGSPPNEAKPFVSELATIAMFMIKVCRGGGAPATRDAAVG